MFWQSGKKLKILLHFEIFKHGSQWENPKICNISKTPYRRVKQTKN